MRLGDYKSSLRVRALNWKQSKSLRNRSGSSCPMHSPSSNCLSMTITRPPKWFLATCTPLPSLSYSRFLLPSIPLQEVLPDYNEHATKVP